MSFALELQRFHQGDISRQELEAAVDRLLEEAPPNLLELQAEFERVSGELDVSAAIVEPIRARIAANTGYSLSRPTVTDQPTGAPPATGNPQNTSDDDRTRITSGNLSHPTRSDYSTPDAQGFYQAQGESRPLGTGDVLGGRFRLEALLGQGGMSQVFRAEDLHAYGNPRVAVKVLSEAFAGHPDALVSLKRETAKAQQLAHPNIVNVRDFGVDGPYIYMHMEYLEGGSLYDELKHSHGRGLPPDEAMSILEGVCEALDYAHKHNIVHADLKPGNFMLTQNVGSGAIQAKIIDFGIARPARVLGSGDDQATIYDPGNLRALTVAYASPEMQEGKDPDPRDDIYALGCIAYEIFTGSHPFDRISAGQAKSRRLVPDEHPALNKRQMRAIRRALSFDRATRTATAGEFLREFRAADSPARALPWKQVGIGALAVAATAAILATIVIVDPFADDPFAPGRTFRDCPDCPEMTVLAAGEFRQGSTGDGSASFANERPVHPVRLAQPFSIGTTEVTVGEYRRFAVAQGMGTPDCQTYGRNGWSPGRGHNWTDPGFAQSDDHPVTCISWQEAANFAAWLGSQTGFVYRLPSAAEWEYAAAGGTATATWWAADEDVACTAANIADRSAQAVYPAWDAIDCSDASVNTAPVGSFEPNPFGLRDTLGNAFEWVLDCWNADYVGAPADGGPRLQGDCTQRELRGGSWFTHPDLVTRSFRNRLPANTRTSSIGFRVVRELERNTK